MSASTASVTPISGSTDAISLSPATSATSTTSSSSNSTTNSSRSMVNEASLSIVSELHPNDVLHGRGAAYDRMEGNMRFRALIKTRASAYRHADSSDKKQIALEVVENVHANGGRFLRVVDSVIEAKELNVAAGDVVWVRVPAPVALEKVKQALRDCKRQETARGQSAYESPASDARRMHTPASLDLTNAPLLEALRSRGIYETGGVSAATSASNSAQLRQALQLNRSLALDSLGAGGGAGLSSLVHNVPTFSTSDRLARLQLLQQMERDEQQQRQVQALLQRRERAALVQRLQVLSQKPPSPTNLDVSLLGARSAFPSLGGGALKNSNGSFTGTSLMNMLQAQVLAESARDLPFLLKIQSVYRTVLQTPSNHRLTPAESQSLIDAVRSIQVAIARVAAAGEGGSSSSDVSAARPTAPHRATLPALSNPLERVGATPTAAAAASIRGDSGATYSKETLARRAAIMADCAPTRRKRGYMNESNSVDEWRLAQQKRAKLHASR